MSFSSRPPRAAGSPRPALAVLSAGTLMIILDGSIVTVALPAIQHDLGFSPANLTWTVNAYLIAFAGLLLLAGRLGDLIGRRRVFVGGLALFTAASLLCGVSTSQGMLIAARFVQGMGGAAASAVSLGMIVALFPEPRERGKAIGAFSFVGAAGASIGQVLGGTLTQGLNWHWIFFINLPIGVATMVLALRVLEPDQGTGHSVAADGLGAALVTAGLMLGVYTIVETGRYGWASAHTVGLAAFTAALLAGFVLRQAKAASPLLPLRMFRSRNVSGANLVQILMISAMFGFQVLIALYLENVLGYGAAATGLALLPAAVMIGACTRPVGPAGGPLRRTHRPAGRPRAAGGGDRPAGQAAGARRIRHGPAADDATDRRWRPRALGEHHARHVRSERRRRGHRLRPVHHHPAGGRRARGGRAHHPGHRPHQGPARHRPRPGGGPDRRVPRGVRDRGRAAGRGAADRGGRAAQVDTRHRRPGRPQPSIPRPSARPRPRHPTV